jgi:hypothetical protein
MQLTAAEVLARWTLRRDTRRSGGRRQGHIDVQSKTRPLKDDEDVVLRVFERNESAK